MTRYVAIFQLFLVIDLFLRLQSETEFARTCSAMMAKMIDTVPAGVTLTDEIALLPVKVSSAYISVVKDKLIFETFLRVRICSRFSKIH